ncbi:MAG: dolichyl-phosphate beta-glucosyltransferase [bacterium]
MSKIYLSVVIPVYNEEKRVKDNLKKIKEYLDGQGFSYEIIISNDGSVDRTVEEVKNSGVDVVLLNNKKNHGKGFAVKAGMLKAQGDFAVFLDADLATPIAELPKLLGPLENGDAQAVVGSRAIGKKDIERSWVRSVIGLGFRKLKSLIVGIEVFDSQCGFKGFKREVVRPIFERQTINGWSFDVEILLIASKLGYKILEVPISWTEQGNSKMKLWREIPRMFWELLRIRRGR